MKTVLPAWFRQQVPGPRAGQVRQLLEDYKLHTVCREAACPNSGYCFGQNCLTFMILGNVCTRNCSFCNISDAGTGLKPVPAKPVEGDGPRRIAAVTAELGLDHVVVTSVSRDDLADGGAKIFSLTTEALRRIKNRPKVELLIPDFQGKAPLVEMALDPAPDVAAHNLETVSRLYRLLRPQADYRRSLGVLKTAKELHPDLITKSSLMLGLGEKPAEVMEAMRQLRRQDCDCLVLGQYLAPSPRHYPVKGFISPEQFEGYRKTGLGLGFKSVLALPLARASYLAKEIYEQATRGIACMN